MASSCSSSSLSESDVVSNSAADESSLPPAPLPSETNTADEVAEAFNALHLEGNCMTLKTTDEEEFVITKAMAMQCQTLRHIIEDECHGSLIPVQVDSFYLKKVIQYLRKHANGKSTVADLNAFDKEFTDVSTDDLYFLLLAANYLEAKDLLKLLCKKVADMISGKTSEQIRQMFNIKNDLAVDDKGKGETVVVEEEGQGI